MVFNLKSIDTLTEDLDNKTLSGGYTLSGDIKGEKVSLHLEDHHGKRSQFSTQTFYGKISGNTLKGSFRISNYALFWLVLLFVIAVENIVTSIIFNGLSGILLSSVIIVSEIVYFFMIKRISFEHNKLIENYLNSI